jgi:hypothetical protein
MTTRRDSAFGFILLYGPSDILALLLFHQREAVSLDKFFQRQANDFLFI